MGSVGVVVGVVHLVVGAMHVVVNDVYCENVEIAAPTTLVRNHVLCSLEFSQNSQLKKLQNKLWELDWQGNHKKSLGGISI